MKLPLTYAAALLSLCWLPAVQAKSNRKPSSNAEYKVIVLDKDHEQAGSEVYSDAEVTLFGEQEAEEALPPKARDEILHQAGLSSLVKDWDAFDKDMLTLRLEKKSLEEVAQKYGAKIERDRLLTVKKLIQEFRSQKKGKQ